MKLRIIIGTLLIAHGASASTLTRALQENIYKAEAILRQEHVRYNKAKASYNASKAKLSSAKSRLKKALADERKEEAQLRAIEEANARYYEIPKYDYNSDGTGVSWRTR